MEEKEETVTKITITKEAEEAVSQIVNRVNDGFDAGRVNRQDVASWILIQYAEGLADADIQQIRSAFFNEIALLEVILKRAKQSGKLSADLKSVLLEHINVPAVSIKKPKRGLTKEFINDEHKKAEDVA